MLVCLFKQLGIWGHGRLGRLPSALLLVWMDQMRMHLERVWERSPRMRKMLKFMFVACRLYEGYIAVAQDMISSDCVSGWAIQEVQVSV